MRSAPDSLVRQHLRPIRADMARVADDTRTLRSETTAFRRQVAAAIEARPDRVERRLVE